MSSVRDLTVSIDFDDINTSALMQVNAAMDAIENSLNRMDRLINDASSEFSQFGAEGAAAGGVINVVFNNTENTINNVSSEINNASTQIEQLAASTESMGAIIERSFHESARAADDLGDQLNQNTAAMAELAAVVLTASQVMEASLRSAADEAGDTERKIHGISFALVGAAAKAAIFGAALGSALGLATAMAAPLLGVVMGLAGGMAAAGIGAVAYGAVAVSALGSVFQAAGEVEKAQAKIDNATSTKARIKAEKELAAIYAGMSEQQKGALEQLNQFKSFWGDFSAQFQNPVFDAFTQGLKLTQSMLTGLTPTISNVSGVVTQLLEEFNGFVSGGGLNSFFEWLSTTASSSLYNWSHIAGNVFHGFFGMLQAFTPLGKEMENGLVGMTEKFAAWGQSLSSNDSFKGFIEYVKTNGPVLMDTFGNIWKILSDVAVALAPLGTVLLSAFEGLTQKISELSPGLKDVVQSAMDFGSTVVDNWKPISAVVAGIATAIAVWKVVTLAQNIALWAMNAALFANPLMWVAIAIGAVVTAGILLWQNWDWIQQKAGELWAWITEKWSSLLEWTVSTWNGICQAVSDAWNSMIEWVVTKATEFWTSVTTLWNNILTTTSEIWNLIITTVVSLWDSFILWVVTKATELWTNITTIWNNILMTASMIWTMIVTAIVTAFNTVVSTVISIATAIWNAITTTFNSILTTAISIWTAISNGVYTAFQTAVDFVISVATSIYDTISSYFNNVLSTTQDIWNSVKSAISDAMNAASDAVASFFDPLLGFIDTAKGAWDGLVGMISNFKMPEFNFPSLPSWLGGGGADGSHATGLSTVPFNGYKAILHKGETVLTAGQSSALQEAGILDASGKKPRVDASSGGEGFAPTSSTGGGGGGSTTVSPTINITIDGSKGDPNEVAKQVKEQLRSLFTDLGLQI